MNVASLTLNHLLSVGELGDDANLSDYDIERLLLKSTYTKTQFHLISMNTLCVPPAIHQPALV